MNLPEYPIHEVLPELLAGLAENPAAVLTAEPGSGKTTIVPLVLLDEPWLQGRKIIMLEPRRLAARAAAVRLSQLAGERLGGLVGYRVRFDSKVSRKTRVEVVTEGVMIRMLQNDPELKDVGLVIFDEFHERALQADLALALCLDVRQIRADLKILVMSATIDAAGVADLLGDAPVISGRGRCFPVTVHYLERPSTEDVVTRTTRSIEKVLNEQEGDILVFLPGAGEIKGVQSRFGDRRELACLVLYGDLPLGEQSRVFDRQNDRRRLILSTPIAETSLTIEGITTVVDSGLLRSPRFEPASGLTRLETIPVSKASAEQRAGRGGRLGPGHCYRLWTEAEQYSKADYLVPEIINADLAPLMLELALWGVADPARLQWPDPPRRGQVKQARELLQELEAIDGKRTITPLGRELAGLPLHPRLAMMLIRGREQDMGSIACKLAAILNNRDPIKGEAGRQSADIEDRLRHLEVFEKEGSRPVWAGGGDPAACRRILQEAAQYKKILGSRESDRDKKGWAGNLLAYAYPDRIAMKRPDADQFLLASGRGAVLPGGDHLNHSELIVAASLDRGRKQGRIFLAAGLTMAEFRTDHGHLVKTKKLVRWDDEKQRVSAVTEEQYGSLVLSEKRWPGADPQLITDCLLKAIQRGGPDCLPWDRQSRDVQARLQTLHCWQPESWPPVDDETLMADPAWLTPYLNKAKSFKDLQKLDMTAILLAGLSWEKQQKLDRLAPSHLQVESGSRIRLQYRPGEPPVLPVRIQEMFGCRETPAVAGGKIKVILHLLSPARRPIQVTSDLTAFWRNTYREVKKELAGRYPKHFWPDDPLTAKATSRAKPRRK